MLKVIISNLNNLEILLKNIPKHHPIFVKENDKFVGMIIQEQNQWIIRLGGKCGATGFHDTREICLLSGMMHGYEYFIEEI